MPRQSERRFLSQSSSYQSDYGTFIVLMGDLSNDDILRAAELEVESTQPCVAGEKRGLGPERQILLEQGLPSRKSPTSSHQAKQINNSRLFTLRHQQRYGQVKLSAIIADVRWDVNAGILVPIER